MRGRGARPGAQGAEARKGSNGNPRRATARGDGRESPTDRVSNAVGYAPCQPIRSENQKCLRSRKEHQENFHLLHGQPRIEQKRGVAGPSVTSAPRPLTADPRRPQLLDTASRLAG